MINKNTAHPAEVQILSQISPNVIERAKSVRLMAFDVDGILTDGSLWYNEHGETIKVFNALDGHGLRLLKESGIKVALITGRKSPITDRRASELGINVVLQGVRDKADALVEIAHEYGFTTEQMGFMGDDLIDLAAMQRSVFAASVINAPIYIQQAAHWISSKPSGSGAARQCCDVILAAQGKLSTFMNAQAMLMTGAMQ